MKKLIALLLVLVMALTFTACSAQILTSDAYIGMEPAAAAATALEATEDKLSLSDLVRVPFGYLMDWLDRFTRNYGVALILFSLIVKLVLLPMSIKSRKSTLKMSRISPIAKSLEEKYGDDKQKYQQELMALYKEEGVNPSSGCLWSFVPLLILFPLYYVIREPVTYMLHNSRSMSAAIVAFTQASGLDFGRNGFYAQLTVTGRLSEFMDALKACTVTAGAKLRQINFRFLGIDLAAVPTYNFWTMKTWGEWGLFLMPVISAGTQLLSMLISQKTNNQVATDADGEKDEEAAKSQNQSNMMMMFMFPLMSLWIGYSMPAAMSVYWIAQAVLGTVQDLALSKHFGKIYAAEDAIRQENAALRRAEEYEKERQRQQRREENPDGIMDNVSKKKLKQLEKDAAERAAREYEARKNPKAPEEAAEDAPLSGIAERPFCKGRAYDPDRYSRKQETEE